MYVADLAEANSSSSQKKSEQLVVNHGPWTDDAPVSGGGQEESDAAKKARVRKKRSTAQVPFRMACQFQQWVRFRSRSCHWRGSRKRQVRMIWPSLTTHGMVVGVRTASVCCNVPFGEDLDSSWIGLVIPQDQIRSEASAQTELAIRCRAAVDVHPYSHLMVVVTAGAGPGGECVVA